MAFVALGIDARRLCIGLGKTLCTPTRAIKEIMDNSVNADASKIVVKVVRIVKDKSVIENNVKEYLVIDNGKGMDEAGIKDALKLGSPEDNYDPETLSKFGLGLKSASFSQGEVLEIISSDGDGPFLKYRVSLTEIMEQGQYGADRLELNEDDQALVAEHLDEGHGTIVRIGDIRKGNHPSIKSTVEELQQRVGVIYYYFMRDDGLVISVEGQICQPLDPLFIEEAEQNGNLNENDWTGRETRWIEKPTELTLDAERNVKVWVEVTQLPHPPTFALPPGNSTEQARTRDKYRIDAGNYGFYVYRNKRLLSWAERFSGQGAPIVPQDNDFYAFRGRILLNSDADDVINIDVKKSQIMLSDEAYKALDDVSATYKRKSKRAWKYAGDQKKRRDNADSIGTANRIAGETVIPEELPGEPDTEEAYREAAERERAILEEQEQRFNLAADGEAGNASVMGESADPTHQIFRVSHIEDHALWEPYYDPDKKNCVRINEVHRFAQLIYQDNSSNGALQTLFNLFLLQLAAAENHIETKFQKYPRKEIEAILKGIPTCLLRSS